MNQLQIHDIKELSDIPDISFYLFIALSLLGFVLILILLFLIYTYFKNRTKNKRKDYFKYLKELDLKESKKAAYDISKYTRLLATSEIEKKLCDELNEELEKFKYKKEVDPLSDEVKILFGRFMDTIDV